MTRGIYLVANLKSQEICENLIFSIRGSGCTLPIRLIHFGGKEVNSKYILQESEIWRYEQFPEEAKIFIANLRSVLTDCPMGFLYRFLAWFSDWDEFIYSDNDVVALCNWSNLFDYLKDYDLVHADEEYTTNGRFNYLRPDLIKTLFGEFALESAMTAGHVVVKRNDKMVDDINKAVEWFKQNPAIPKKHDQSLMHVASLLGQWKMLNLCKPPSNWLSSWAGDYRNSLEIVQKVQAARSGISHVHYSGSTPKGNAAIQDLLFSNFNDKKRLEKLFIISTRSVAGIDFLTHHYTRIKKGLERRLFKKK